MESMRDTRRIMDREIQKGSTPLKFETITVGAESYQEIPSREKFIEVLQYLHRLGGYKNLAGKTVINNVYTYMRGKEPDFKRARSIIDREKIYLQMVGRERRMKPEYMADCYIETAKCYFSLPKEEWEKHRMECGGNEAFGFIMSDRYILGLYKYCREARLDMAFVPRQQQDGESELVRRFISLKDVSVMAHCLLLDDVWTEDGLIGAKLYTIFTCPKS